MDSSKLSSAGETAATITVLELPPKLSLSRNVSVESRYGTWMSPFALLATLWMQP
jgi:hypothetical protein